MELQTGDAFHDEAQRTQPNRIESVLIGIDAGRPSQVAVDWVIRRSQHVPMRVRLVTAFDVVLDDLTADQLRLDETRARFEAAAPETSVETELVDHSIWTTLVEASRDVDLLVIGSHHPRPLRSAVVGDLQSRLAALSHCPVVIVPDDWRPRAGDIVVGIADDESASESALDFAVREADARGRRLTLVHAWQHSAVSTRKNSPTGASREAEARARHVGILAAASDRTHRRFPALLPHESLVERATGAGLIDQSHTAELLVVGTHAPRLNDLVLGSVVKQLLRHGEVPVCIVPSAPVPVPS